MSDQIPYVEENVIDPAASLNVSIRAINSILQIAVLSIGETVPPIAPTEGDRYIVGENATDAWLNQDFKLARFIDSAWRFFEIRYAVNLTDGELWIRNSAGWKSLALSKNPVFESINVTGNSVLGSMPENITLINGCIALGGTSTQSRALNIANQSLAGISQTGLRSAIRINSNGTAAGYGFVSAISTQASPFTTTLIAGMRIYDVVKGSGNEITNQHGILVDNLQSGANNYGITLQLTEGTNKRNFNAEGSAYNYLNGNTGIGEQPTSGAKLSVAGPVRIGQYTLSTLPNATAFSGCLIDVTNATGGPKTCRSDGTNWKILNTLTTVS